jgi:signal peptidase
MRTRLVERALTVAAVVGLGALWFAVLRPQALGGPVTYLVIRGDSMEPTYHGGDLVIVRSAASYGIGDVVAYRVPEGDIGAGHLVIHRIVGGDGRTGFLLGGDNNPSLDPWMPRSADVAGRAWAVIPAAGRLLALLRQPVLAGAFAASIAVAWVVSRRRPSRTPSVVGTQAAT